MVGVRVCVCVVEVWNLLPADGSTSTTTTHSKHTDNRENALPASGERRVDKLGSKHTIAAGRLRREHALAAGFCSHAEW